MYKQLSIALIVLATTTSSYSQIKNASQTNDYKISDVRFNKVKLNDRFWMPRIKQNQEVTIPIALKQCYETGRIDNFKKAGKIIDGYFNTEYPFDDSDVFKIVEGISYSIQNIPNKELEKQLDEIIAYIAAAQENDGYLYTARTAAEPGKLHPWINEKRWVNAPDLSHELYNMGHLYEAAVAHYVATGKRTLLDVAIKNADLLVNDYLINHLTYEPGHQIIEAGLVKLYRVTGNKDYLNLAKYFLDLRGDKGKNRTEYSQTHLPITQQKEAVGHAVRATYMYSGIADVAALTGNKEYISTINTIWDNVIGKKYYITGGIGALHGGEAFGGNYCLPNLTAYCETCAAIANVYWNWRMFLYEGKSKYYDVIERTLYNGVLSGISLSGDHFFYPNPLESKGGHNRSEWFGCACCPSNMCRFIASVGGYMYAHSNKDVYVNLYAQGSASINLNENDSVQISQYTDYPWNGNIKITIDKALKRNTPFTLKLRLPGWAQGRPVPSDLYKYVKPQADKPIILVNGKKTNYYMEEGYMSIARQWKKGDVITFELPMDIHLSVAHENVVDDNEKVALERGPIVYCMEKIDNPVCFDNMIICPDNFKCEANWTDELNGLIKLTIHGKMATEKKVGASLVDAVITAIPYYAWDNRGDKGMKIWVATNTDVLVNPIGSVEINDTIKRHIVMEPRIDYTPQESVFLPKSDILDFLGLSESDFDSQMGSNVVYSAINPDGSVDIESTATAPGHWFNQESYTCKWGGDSKIFSEFHNDGVMRLQIGQFPKSCKKGDTFTIRQALTRRAGPTNEARRIVLEQTIEIK